MFENVKGLPLAAFSCFFFQCFFEIIPNAKTALKKGSSPFSAQQFVPNCTMIGPSLTVLQVYLDGSESEGCFLTFRSLAGEELGTKPLQWEDTLQDLENAVRG